MTGSTNGTDEAQTVRVTLVVHPPERRRRRSVIVASGCCCSCCCSCCLHSIGGVVGAMMAGSQGLSSAAVVSDVVLDDGERLLKMPPGLVPASVDFAAARARGQRVYWTTVGVLCLLTALVSYGLIPLLAAPLIQLVGALVAVMILGSSGRSRILACSVVGKMTLGMLAGTAAGTAVMLGLIVLFRLCS
jgi:hypothetical protein